MSLSLWHDVLPWLRPGAEEEMPEHIRLALQHAQWGKVARLPERGKLPRSVFRARIRAAVELRIESGMTRLEAIGIVAEEAGIHPRTVERQLTRRRDFFGE